MKITREQVEHVAKLARISLTEEEKQEFTIDMEKIIAFEDKLSELDTTGVSPTIHILPNQNVFREDIIIPSYDREKLMENAHSKEDGCFAVPKIVE